MTCGQLGCRSNQIRSDPTRSWSYDASLSDVMNAVLVHEASTTLYPYLDNEQQKCAIKSADPTTQYVEKFGQNRYDRQSSACKTLGTG